MLDLGFEADLYEDPTGINLVYIQAIEELSNGWILIDNQKTLNQLQQLKEKNLKKEVPYPKSLQIL